MIRFRENKKPPVPLGWVVVLGYTYFKLSSSYGHGLYIEY